MSIVPASAAARVTQIGAASAASAAAPRGWAVGGGCEFSVVATAIARVPATCGELLQGVDDDGPVLVSLPVALTGSVEVALVREAVVSVAPDLPLACRALELALDRVGWTGGAVVRLGGEVPRARGMGSSTVDVAGVIGCVMAMARVSLPPAELVALTTAVEPSDSSPLPGLWAVDHVGGTRALRLGDAPARWHLVVVDSGAPTDTAEVHRRLGAGPWLADDAVSGLLAAGAVGDSGALARAATASALRNQERLPHPAFEAVRQVASSVGALGVCVAHSGSLCALICDGAGRAATGAEALRATGLSCGTLRVAAPGMGVEVRAGARV